jgi:hypothetical protein
MNNNNLTHITESLVLSFNNTNEGFIDMVNELLYLNDNITKQDYTYISPYNNLDSNMTNILIHPSTYIYKDIALYYYVINYIKWFNNILYNNNLKTVSTKLMYPIKKKYSIIFNIYRHYYDCYLIEFIFDIDFNMHNTYSHIIHKIHKILTYHKMMINKYEITSNEWKLCQ